MRRLVIGTLLAALVLSSGACTRSDLDKGTVGIALPARSSARWLAEGQAMKKQLEGLGFRADLEYADNDAAKQASQLRKMINDQDKALVVAPVDPGALGDVLKKAGTGKIPVIAYDRLITGTGNVDYYAAFDNFNVGVLQGSYIVDRLGVAKKPGPFTVELFAGAPDDNSAGFFFNGALSVLKPYMDDGRLTVRSDQRSFAQAATPRWDAGAAQSRMDRLLRSAYRSKRLDAVLSPSDEMSGVIVTALRDAGYGSRAKAMPVVTGEGAEIAAVKSILHGGQSMTVFRDGRKLVQVAVDMVTAVVNHRRPQVNDSAQYNNGVKAVPAYLLQPVTVDKSNCRKLLVDSGYYSDAELR